MGAGRPKQFIEMADGTSIIRKTVDAFRTGSISELADIIVVTAPAGFEMKTYDLVNEGLPCCISDDYDDMEDNDRSDHAREYVEEQTLAQSIPDGRRPKRAFVITGGNKRQDSVRNALSFLVEYKEHYSVNTTGLRPEEFSALVRKSTEDDIVLIHDGARPFVTPEIIQGVAEAALKHGAAITAVPVKDTIRDSENGTLDRSRLYSVQTPQGFRFGLIRDAVEQACKDGFYGTDDGSLAERAGVMPVIVPGSYANIKITTPEDLK